MAASGPVTDSPISPAKTPASLAAKPDNRTVGELRRTDPQGQPFEARVGPGLVRVVGLAASELVGAELIPPNRTKDRAGAGDDAPLFHRAGLPNTGAHVPLIVHEPTMVARTVDAADRAAEIIADLGGSVLFVAPFVGQDAVAGQPVSLRQWNHAVAMIERLEELCLRHQIVPAIRDLIGGRSARWEGVTDSEPVRYVLDTGNFLSDGYVPAPLISPVRFENDGVDTLPDRPTHPYRSGKGTS